MKHYKVHIEIELVDDENDRYETVHSEDMGKFKTEKFLVNKCTDLYQGLKSLVETVEGYQKAGEITLDQKLSIRRTHPARYL